jgi:hypothetical protein
VARSVACIRIRTRPLLRGGTMNQPSIRREAVSLRWPAVCVCVCNIYTYIRVYIQIHSRAHVINERLFKFTAWRVFSYFTIAKPDDLYYIDDVNTSM